MVCREHGEKAHLKTGNVQTVTIPSNTIVINTNKIPKDYSCFNIYHECIHFELHYMFFRLQQMGSNDVRQIKVKRVEVEKGKEYHDPIYFMEKRADRGAYGLIMPRTHTQKMIADECEQATGYQNFGEKYEMVGKRIADTLCLPHFRVRARMIQQGHMEARGALNYVNSRLIHPFAFDPNAWKENEISFVIDPGSVKQLRKECEDLQKLLASDQYIYADGHVVRNEPRFVTVQQEEAQLTDEARKQVDLCCLRFIRRYVQKDVGQYVYGRMFYDPHYVEQTEFYLSDLINLKQMDDLDAKMEYKDSFPRTFVKAFDMLMKKNGETRETIAPKLHTTDRSLHEWLYDPERKITADFVVGISLMWQVPDWISQMLLDRAGIHMCEFNRRHQALEYIRTVLWDKGVEEANAYLKSKGLAPLAI